MKPGVWWVTVSCLVAAWFVTGRTRAQGPGGQQESVAGAQSFEAGGATIRVEFGAGLVDRSQTEIMTWVRRAAEAVSLYYGRFPVRQEGVLIDPRSGDDLGGTTWGGVRGMQGFSRIRFGEHVTEAALMSDWVMTHEMVHTAFPDQSREQHWLEEGLATYVEPVTRVQAGQMPVEKMWGDMMHGMVHGEPADGDEGLDRTHTWGRTYWGGALFCLVADVEIRKATGNRKGLQDALRGIVAAGGTIDTDWPAEKALAAGDAATGTKVLTEMYARWSVEAVSVDLDGLWKQLGVAQGPGGVVFDAKAPLAAVREAITQKR